ncbi:hypothetical protein AcW1_008372 [Taiwanofungus camphoratus]|nr:hypothetical protein AcW1_008372 [Antrodia cinnamomea]
MSETSFITKGKERAIMDELFLERLETLFDKSLTDLRAFAERESCPFGEVRRCMAEWHCRYLFDHATTPIPDVQERIQSVLRATSQSLESLQGIAGLQSFFLVVNPHDPTDDGFLGGTVLGREFWRGHRGCGASGAKAFTSLCIKAVNDQVRYKHTAGSPPGPNPQPTTTLLQTKGTASSLKAEVYANVRNALRSTTGIRNAEMKWSDHSKLIVYGTRLVGWPTGVPMQNPSTLSVSQNKQVLEALNNGSMSFIRVGDLQAGSVVAVPKEGSLLTDGADSSENAIDFSWLCQESPESSSSHGAHTNFSLDDYIHDPETLPRKRHREET